MNFDVIDGLNEKDIAEMYDNIVEGLENSQINGDDMRVAMCCCFSTDTAFEFDRVSCRSWCRSQGSSCKGWFANGTQIYFCYFSC